MDEQGLDRDGIRSECNDPLDRALTSNADVLALLDLLEQTERKYEAAGALCNDLQAERDVARRERDGALATRNRALREREYASDQAARLIEERDEALAKVRLWKTRLVEETAELRARVARLTEERDALARSNEQWQEVGGNAVKGHAAAEARVLQFKAERKELRGRVARLAGEAAIAQERGDGWLNITKEEITRREAAEARVLQLQTALADLISECDSQDNGYAIRTSNALAAAREVLAAVPVVPEGVAETDG